MKANIVILNGPPGCGKDTAADFLAKTFTHTHHMRMKDKLFEDVKDYCFKNRDFDDRDLLNFFFRYQGTKMKEEHWDRIGMSPRQMLQHVSEDIVKPAKGLDHYGREAAKNVADLMFEHMDYTENQTFVFSDGGFDDEAIGLIDELKQLGVELGNIGVLKIKREGFTFEKDTRSYINPHDIATRTEELVTYRNIENESGCLSSFLFDISIKLLDVRIDEELPSCRQSSKKKTGFLAMLLGLCWLK